MRTVLLLWLWLTTACAAQIPPHAEVALPSAPSELVAGPLGRRLLVTCGVGTDQGRVLLLERASGATVGSLDAPGLRCAAFFDLGQSVFVDTDQGFWLWHLSKASGGVASRRFVEAPNSAAGICPDGSVAVACQGGTLKAFNALGTLVDTMPGGEAAYDRLEIGADGLNLALTNRTGFYLYDLVDKACFSHGLGGVGFHPSGLSMVRQSPSGWIVDFRLDNGSRLANPVSGLAPGCGVQVSPDGQLLLSLAQGGAQVWSYPRLQSLTSRPLSSGERAVFGGDSRAVVSWSASGSSVLWNPRNGAVLDTVPVPSGAEVIDCQGASTWLARLEARPGAWSFCDYEP